MRRVEVVSGTPRLVCDLDVTVDQNENLDPGTRGGSHVSFTQGQTPFRKTTDAPLGLVMDGTPFVPAPEIAFVITPDETLSDDASVIVHHRMTETTEYWRN